MKTAGFLALLLALGTQAFGQPSASACDVNLDGSTNVADVQVIVNEALGLVAAAHDLFHDGAVNVADLQTVTSAVLGLGCAADSTGGTLTVGDFNPKSGPIGTAVSLTGANLGSVQQVSMPQQGGGTISQPLSSVFPSVVTFVVAAGTATGPITVGNGAAAASTAGSFTVTPSNTFNLTASPPSANLVQGQSVAYAVQLTSGNGFGQLAQLAVSGVPAGVTATFKPSSITAGQTSVLTLTAPANQAVATASLAISAAATVDGLAVSQTAPAALAVVAPTTSLLGRTVVADAVETPLAGVTITMLGKDGNGNSTACTGSAVSDAAGNFNLANLPLLCIGPQLVGFNGLTATSPTGQFAGVNLVFTLIAGQVTASPVLVHLPRIDNTETFNVQQNATTTQTYSFGSIPGLSVVVYPGTTFTMPDGTKPNPFPLTAVQVPVDRLPDLKPNVPTMIRVFIVAFQPANATTNEPVAVYFPNTLNTPPGTDMVLMTLDPTHGTMVPYGTGAVSADGSQIVPDPDPAHPGHLYGLIHFDWHGPMPPPPDDYTHQCHVGCEDGGPFPPPPPPPGCDDDECYDDGQTPPCGDPVDPSTGLEVLTSTDIGIFGPRGSIFIERVYRSLLTTVGPFGIGTQHNYGYLLDTGNPLGAGVINLIMPDNTRIPFTLQSNGTFLNMTVPNFSGAVMSVATNNQVTTLTRRDGMQFVFTIDGRFLSRLTSITDAHGNTITLTRNPSNPVQITQVVDPVGRTLSLTYDGTGRITSVSDPIGRKVSYVYDALGRLATYTNAEGGVTTYGYDSQHRMTSIIDPRGVTIATSVYDTNGRVAQQTLADGSVLQFQYTLMNSLVATSPIIQTQITDGLGNQFSYRFNEYGFLVQFTDAIGQTRIFDRQLPPPPPLMELRSAIHPRISGSSTVTPRINALLGVSGVAACSTCSDPGAGDFTFTYDVNGNVASKTDSFGNVTNWAYDPVFNKVTGMKDALGQTTRFSYDAQGSLLSTTDARGNVTSFTYNTFGQVTQITDAAKQNSTFTYDTFGNLATATDPLGKAQSFRYDPVSRLVEAADRLGRKSSIIYDRLNRTTATRDANGQTTAISYDAVGNVLGLTDARNSTTAFEYDGLSRVTTRTSPLGKTETRTYDPDGNVVQFVDRRGQVSTFTYDALNRLIRERYQDGSAVNRSYDARGRIEQVIDKTGGTFKLAYDLTGRLVAATSPNGEVAYTRDALRRVKTRQVTGAAAVTYNYDVAGNLSAANSTAASAGFTYDARNLLSGESRSNGVSSNYAYDAVGRVLSIAHQLGSTVINSHVMTYDALGNRTGNLTNISAPLITAAAGSTFDAENRLLTRSGTTYTYDDNGNRATETSSSGATTYSWDSRNRLTSIVTPQLAVNFTYDFRGMMIGKKTTIGGSTSSELYLLDDRTNVVWQSVNGQASSILSGRRIDQHIAVIPTSGSVSFGLADAVNSTVAVTNSSGAKTGTFTYEPFGQISSQTGQFPFQFTGRTNTGVGGLYYFRARFYDSVAGRFLSRDPIGFASGDSNLYRYALNRSISLLDPSGLDAQDNALGAVCAIAAYCTSLTAPTIVGELACVPSDAICIVGTAESVAKFVDTTQQGIQDWMNLPTPEPPFTGPRPVPCPAPTPPPSDQCVLRPTPVPMPTPAPVACPTPTPF